MTDYSQMSDQQINDLVDSHIYDDIENAPDSDYCNNPADAWPIIVDEKIMLSPHCADEEWKAQIHLGKEGTFDNYASAWHKNPLRAAMIVFLMMRENV